MTAQVYGAADKLSKQVADTANGTITFAGSPPMNVPGATAGQQLVSDGAGNMTPQTPSSSFTMGLQYLTGGGIVDNTVIATAISDGYDGIFLDPNYTWDMTGVTLSGLGGFIIESRMTGAIGYNGSVLYDSDGYIATSTGGSPPADGIQVYSSNPSGGAGNATQGIIFRGCVFVGGNSNSVIHWGGGLRACVLESCLVYNTNTAANSYGMIADTAVANFSNEDCAVAFTGIAGGWAALGIGTADGGNHSIDFTWDSVTTASGSGPYSIVANGGFQHHFRNYYDKSSPATATVYNHGATLFFDGGADQNNSASGVDHLIDNTNAATTLLNRQINQGSGGATIITISAGQLVARGRTKWIGTIAVSGTGSADLSDPAGNFAGITVTGSAGQLMVAGDYNPAADPTLTGWTGTTVYQGPAVVASGRGLAQTGTVSVTWTPPMVQCKFRVSVMIHPTTAGTSTIPSISFTEYGGSARSYNIAMWQQNGTATAPSYLCNAVDTFLGQVVSDTDTSGSLMTVTITPTGSTYRYSITIEQVTGD